MGNCIRREAPASEWGGDEWDFPATEETDGLIGGPATTAREVKIKMTKKQLVELIGKADMKEMSVQQVLAQLVGVGAQFHEPQHRAWRPALQSIPESD